MEKFWVSLYKGESLLMSSRCTAVSRGSSSLSIWNGNDLTDIWLYVVPVDRIEVQRDLLDTTKASVPIGEVPEGLANDARDFLAQILAPTEAVQQ